MKTTKLIEELQLVEKARLEAAQKFENDLIELIESASQQIESCNSTPRSKAHLLPKSYLLFEWEQSQKKPAFTCVLFLIFLTLLLQRIWQ